MVAHSLGYEAASVEESGNSPAPSRSRLRAWIPCAVLAAAPVLIYGLCVRPQRRAQPAEAIALHGAGEHVVVPEVERVLRDRAVQGGRPSSLGESLLGKGASREEVKDSDDATQVQTVKSSEGIKTVKALRQAKKAQDGGAEECLGFDLCPEYPRPYEFGNWPQTFKGAGTFPVGFIWGMGTASYQVEGAYREDGRGASIWDTFSGADTVGMPGANCSYCCKKAPCPINKAMSDKGATGNVACDHYHSWRSDVALMKSMGLRHYRFSISWPRLVPTGKIIDGVNPKAMAFYNGLIDELLAAGITPYVTLYHWDLPQGLLDPPQSQGWWSRDADGKPNGQIIPDWLDYVELCFSEFGDRVKTWLTFNEPWSFTFLASGWGKAPSIEQFANMSIDPFVAGHNVLNAHAAAVELYRRKFQLKQRGKIGITNNCEWREPKTTNPADIAAAERALEFQLGWFSDPIFGTEGDYPPAMRRLFGERLPQFTEEQRLLLRGSADFFGLNHYGTGFTAFAPDKPGADMTYAAVSHEGLPRALSVWLFGAGWGLRKILNWVDQRYQHPQIYLTEGGWSLEADSAEAGVADRQRVLYYANYTAEMHKAIYQDSIDVRSYFAWSLLDNYEWERGYAERFGTTYNDFAFGEDAEAPTNAQKQPTPGRQRRQRKNSSCWLEAVWQGNTFVDPDGSAFQGCVSSHVFNARYFDPRYPRCTRKVVVEDGDSHGHVIGTAPNGGETCDGFTDLRWGPFPAVFGGGTVVANFSAVGGPARLTGYWNRNGHAINWGDGQTWTALGSGDVSVIIRK